MIYKFKVEIVGTHEGSSIIFNIESEAGNVKAARELVLMLLNRVEYDNDIEITEASLYEK